MPFHFFRGGGIVRDESQKEVHGLGECALEFLPKEIWKEKGRSKLDSSYR
jgi:hypothetical protein